MKKLLSVAATIAVMSFSAQAGYWDFRIYEYLDASGQTVGTQYFPCFGRPSVTIGTKTSTKVLVEQGTCQ